MAPSRQRPGQAGQGQGGGGRRGSAHPGGLPAAGELGERRGPGGERHELPDHGKPPVDDPPRPDEHHEGSGQPGDQLRRPADASSGRRLRPGAGGGRLGAGGCPRCPSPSTAGSSPGSSAPASAAAASSSAWAPWKPCWKTRRLYVANRALPPIWRARISLSLSRRWAAQLLALAPDSRESRPRFHRQARATARARVRLPASSATTTSPTARTNTWGTTRSRWKGP